MNFDWINPEMLSKYYDMAISWAMIYIPKILWALFILWVGFKIVNKLRNLVKKIMDKQNFDPMLESFLLSLMTGLLKVLVFISAAGILWVETSSFVAMLAAAGLAVGMALSGTLQNFAWGVMILLFKPFKTGDFVEVAGHSWTISKIEIFNTIMLSGDKKTIIIPNSEVTSSSMVNYSNEPKRRIDLTVGISYDDDIDLAKKTLQSIFEKEEKAVHNDGVTIWVSELGADSVNFAFRFFVKSDDYWDIYFQTLENIKKTFDKKGLNFPYPQRDIHLYKEK